MSNYIPQRYVGVITYPCPDTDAALDKPLNDLHWCLII